MLRRALLFFLFLTLAAVPAAGRELVIQTFDVAVTVNLDGSLDVVEVIRPRFTGQWNGIFRTIPIEYRTPQGFNYTLFLDNITATDDNHNSLRVESSRERHYRKLKIWVPNARDTVRTVILSYHVKNGLKFFEDHDELYWNVTGDEWDVPIESANARVQLPNGAGHIRTLAFTGGYGSREQEADISVQGNVVLFKMKRPLSFHEGMTAVVGWDKGLVAEPSALDNSWMFLQSNWPLFIPIFVFAGMFWLWYTRGRDPARMPVTTQYEPPQGMTPAEAGTLIDNSADMRDITATIVDLAVRGFIRIEEREESKMLGLFKDKDYVFHSLKKFDDWRDLQQHEREVVYALFSGGGVTSVKLSGLENKFYSKLPKIRDSIFDSLMKRRCYTSRPDNVKKGWLIGAAIIGFLSFWGGGGMLSGIFGISFATVAVAGIATAAIVAVFGFFMPARTMAGARSLEQVLGFEEFLGRVEADRMERMVRTPEMFEKFLPFAMAFGVERSWAKAFEGIYTQPPQWYTGGNFVDFSPSRFSSDLGGMSTRAAAVMVSAPRSSGGSGFSGGGGGGSSGGGFGGGGGGGF